VAEAERIVHASTLDTWMADREKLLAILKTA